MVFPETPVKNHCIRLTSFRSKLLFAISGSTRTPRKTRKGGRKCCDTKKWRGNKVGKAEKGSENSHKDFILRGWSTVPYSAYSLLRNIITFLSCCVEKICGKDMRARIRSFIALQKIKFSRINFMYCNQILCITMWALSSNQYCKRYSLFCYRFVIVMEKNRVWKNDVFI